MKKIILIILILIILIAGYFLFFNYKKNSFPKQSVFSDELEVIIRDMTQVPQEYYSGDSRYSYGECNQDNDCVVQGCNLEMCSSDENLITTCEISGDHPDQIQYQCGCIKDVCGWYER